MLLLPSKSHPNNIVQQEGVCLSNYLLMTTYSTEIDVFRSQVRYPITPADPVDDRHQICCNQYGKCMKL